MRIAVWVNELAELKLSQTTAMLISGAAARGHEVWVCGIAELLLDPNGRVLARARRVSQELNEERLAGLLSAPREELDLGRCDAVWIRTNPGRDRAGAARHETALGLAELLERRGVCLLNAPLGLRQTQSKLFLAGLPGGLRPRGVVGSELEDLLAYVDAQEGPSVAKPLIGSRGEGVFKLSPRGANRRAVLSLLLERGPVLVQECLPEYRQGDLRLIVLEGEPLEVEGTYACVQRVPQGGDWRSNVHLGAAPTPGEPTAEQLEVARALGARLIEVGIVLAGLDLIGPRAVELNVFSTGGLGDANQFTGVDFVAPILDAFEARALSSQPVECEAAR